MYIGSSFVLCPVVLKLDTLYSLFSRIATLYFGEGVRCGSSQSRAHKTIRGCIYPCKWRCKNEIIFQFSLNGFTFVVIAAPCLAARHRGHAVMKTSRRTAAKCGLVYSYRNNFRSKKTQFRLKTWIIPNIWKLFQFLKKSKYQCGSASELFLRKRLCFD